MKSLVPAAILLSLAGAAHAEFTLYGLIDASVGKSVADDAQGFKADFHSGGDSSSGEGNSTTKFGLKGGTEVSPGIKANFKLESNGITSSGAVNGNFFGRAAWLGFSGDFGEVRLGRQDSVPFQTMVGYDFNGGSNGISALGYANVAPWAPGRLDRSLQYISPNLGGFTAQVGFQPKLGTDTAPSSPTTSKANGQLGLTFATGPVSVSASYASKATEGDKNFASAAASYDFTVVKLSAGYAKQGTALKGYSLGAVAPVFGGSIGAMFGKNTGDSKGKAYELFANKEVYKSTIAYIEYGHADSKAIDGQTAIGALAGVPAGTAGSGFALGVIYIF